MGFTNNNSTESLRTPLGSTSSSSLAAPGPRTTSLSSTLHTVSGITEQRKIKLRNDVDSRKPKILERGAPEQKVTALFGDQYGGEGKRRRR